MITRTAEKMAQALLELGAADEAMEVATGLSLTEIIGLRAERAVNIAAKSPSSKRATQPTEMSFDNL